MKLNVWAPQPSSPDGIAAYAAEQAEALAAHIGVTLISKDEAESSPPADLDLYHLANSSTHGFVYRAAMAHPGVVLLHHWNLHDLVASQTLGRGDAAAYLREMRRAHGEAGGSVARQVARGLGGGLLPALYPLNDGILEASLGVVALTPDEAATAALRRNGLPVLAFPRHVSPLLDPLPTRSEARKALGISETAFVITAPGPIKGTSQLDVAIKGVGELRKDHRGLLLIAAGAIEEGLPVDAWMRDADLSDGLRVTGKISPHDLILHLAAADVVLCLGFPSPGGIPGALVAALGVGRVVLVTAGTSAAAAFPEGVVVPTDPGHGGSLGLEATLSRLVADTALRESLERGARAHTLTHHGVADTARALADFLDGVSQDAERLKRAAALRRPAEGTLNARLLDELRAAAHEIGLGHAPIDFELLVPR